MGTRNLTIVVADGKHIVSQYCQWDGYPGGKGAYILEFARERLSTIKGRKKFIEQLKFVKNREDYQQEIDQFLTSLGVTGNLWTPAQAAKFSNKYPGLSRDTGPKILDMIFDASEGNEVMLYLDKEFAGDSLFCEWAYVLDLDTGTFEVYKGFNKTPLTEQDRFYFLAEEGKNYQPVKLAGMWNLSKLPTKNKFVEYFKENEE